MLKLKPSDANRWVPCPGSVSMQDGRPDTPRHPVTEEGIAIHWAIEQVVQSWPPDRESIELRSFRGDTCPENGVIITEEMVSGGMDLLADVWDRAYTFPEAIQTEKQLTASEWAEGLSGRADVIWRSPDSTHVIVWDFKYGYKPITAIDNWQLLIYGMGMMSDRTERIDLVIVQPRARVMGGPVKLWSLTRDELLKLAEQVGASAAAARGADPMLNSGPHCANCRAAAHCPALRDAGFAAMDASQRAVPIDLDERQIAFELEMIKRATSQLKARYDALEGLAIARIESGQPVPGYEFRRGLSNRSWTHVTNEETLAFGMLSGVDLSEPAKVCSPAKAESRGVPRKLIDLFTERRESAAKLVVVDPNEAREVFHNGRK